MGHLTIIVGAGASGEYGLPVGDQLKHKIADSLNFVFSRGGIQMESGDSEIYAALRSSQIPREKFQGDVNPLLHICRQISEGMPLSSSIDSYIESHSADKILAYYAKLAIARCILKAERSSSLYFDQNESYAGINFSSIESTWLGVLFKNLTGCPIETFRQKLSQIKIICFNYDRCIEHYLYWAVQAHYRLPAKEADDVLSALEIFHPYGSVGLLPWQNQSSNVAYGGTASPRVLLSQPDNLRTYTEGTDPSISDVSKIRTAFASAGRLLFLGFAFHEINMSVLASDRPAAEVTGRNGLVVATSMGLSKSNVDHIKADINKRTKLSDGQMCFADMPAAKIICEYSRFLRLS